MGPIASGAGGIHPPPPPDGHDPQPSALELRLSTTATFTINGLGSFDKLERGLILSGYYEVMDRGRTLRTVAKHRHRSLLRLQFDMKKRRKHSWTNPKTQMAIIADRSAGMSCTAIAEKYGVDKATVSRVCKKFRQEVPRAEMSIDLENWKQRLREKAIAGLDDALDADFDPYKRGSIAVQVLKGLGDFAAENAVQVNHSTLTISRPSCEIGT